jgi:hypothetical protein
MRSKVFSLTISWDWRQKIKNAMLVQNTAFHEKRKTNIRLNYQAF